MFALQTVSCLKTNPICTIAMVVSALLGTGCAGPRPGTLLERSGDEIIVCGQLFHTGAPVVLWMDPGGYDGYRAHRHFEPDEILPSNPAHDPTPYRFSSFRRDLSPGDAADVRENGWSLPMLQEHVDLFVLHYDVCGTSRRCFKVLHDQRGLSVHFMLDVDGTIYQTLDVKERAWHAGPANDRSVGVEIANMGAYENREELSKWYDVRPNGVVFNPPETNGATGIRTKGFVARPAREDPVFGTIQDRLLWQYDLTDAQYASLSRLTATLCRVLPRIKAVAPRDANGELRTTVLTDQELEKFSGVIGHYHLTNRKVDPGPALNWDRVLSKARR